jgi:hypothetical protein
LILKIARWYARSGRNVRAKYAAENRGEFALSGQALSFKMMLSLSVSVEIKVTASVLNQD